MWATASLSQQKEHKATSLANAGPPMLNEARVRNMPSGLDECIDLLYNVQLVQVVRNWAQTACIDVSAVGDPCSEDYHAAH